VSFSHTDVLIAQGESLETERGRALAEYEHARISEDGDRTMAAADRIVDIDARRAALDRIANHFVAAEQSRPRGNAYGLSDDEMDIARNSHGSGTVEDRVKEYAQNKARYQHMRATGAYRDDQGTVRR
jgi:hypothetical protein